MIIGITWKNKDALPHEMVHVKKYGVWWDAFVKVVDGYETSDCCCPERRNAFIAAKNLYLLSAEVDNLEFDRDEYNSPENATRLATQTTARDDAKKTYEDALKTLQNCYDK